MSTRGWESAIADPLGVDRLGSATIEHDEAADGDPAAIERELCSTSPQRGDDAAPIGVAAVDRGLDQRALRDDARGDARLIRVRGAVHGDAKVASRALGIGDELLGEQVADREQRGLECRRPHSSPRRSSAPPAAPLASRMHESLVDVSPSTVTQLKVLSVDA